MLFQIHINYVISYVQYVANDYFLALLLEESTKKSKLNSVLSCSSFAKKYSISSLLSYHGFMCHLLSIGKRETKKPASYVIQQLKQRFPQFNRKCNI